MSTVTLLEFIMKDYELKCNLALAKFLEIPVPHMIALFRGRDTVDDGLVRKIMDKTDLTREEIDEMLSEP